MSEREWKPGDVAVASYDNEVKVYLRVDNPDERPKWQSQDGSHSYDFSKADWWRLLVAIDPESRVDFERIADMYDPTDFDDRWTEREFFIDALQEAFRRLVREQSRPPKPVEPKAFGAVVTDDEGYPWVRIWDDKDPHSIHTPWQRGLAKRAWGDFNTVGVIIREGL